MWNEKDGRFVAGTTNEGLPALDPKPLDTNALPVIAGIAVGDKSTRAMSWVEKHCCVNTPNGKAYDFNDDCDGAAWEFTGQAALAYKALGNSEMAEQVIETMRKSRLPSGGIPAASKDGLTTGFTVDIGEGKSQPWLYYNHASIGQVHIGATCWMFFAEKGYNPFIGTCAVKPDLATR